MKNVILPTKAMIGDGVFISKEISLDEAREWVKTHSFDNCCGNEGVKQLGLYPNGVKRTIKGYDQALCVCPVKRTGLDRLIGLSICDAEIRPVNYTFTLITYISSEKAVNFINTAILNALEYGANDDPSPLLTSIEDIAKDKLEF